MDVSFIIEEVATEADKKLKSPVANTQLKAVQGVIPVTAADKDYAAFKQAAERILIATAGTRNKVATYLEDECHLMDYGVRWFFEGMSIFVADETMKAFVGEGYRSKYTYADAWLEAAKDAIFMVEPSCKGFRPEIQCAWVQFYREMVAKYGDKVGKFYGAVKNMEAFSHEGVVKTLDGVTGGDCVKFCKEYKAKRKYPALGVEFNPEYKDGVEIKAVGSGSSAEEGGMQPGDVIVTVNGKPIKDSAELARIIQDSKVGDKIEIVVLRIGGKPTLTITLKERVFSIGFDTCSPPPEQKKNAPEEDDSTPAPGDEPDPE